MADIKFSIGDEVTVDSRGQFTIDSYKGEGEYQVTMEEVDMNIIVNESRLELITEECIDLPEIMQQTTHDGSAASRSRFKNVTNEDVDDLLAAQENKNTARKTARDVSLLNTFMSENGEMRPIHNIPPVELNDLLCKFIVAARKLDGGDFETNTLRSINSSIERHLRNKNYGYNIRDSIEFTRYRMVMTSKQKELKSQGKGNLPKRSDAVTDEDLQLMWEHKQLGAHTPQSIMNTLWFHNTIHFGLRGADEHRQMKWGDIALKHDTSGSEYLEFNERTSKTRQGNPKGTRDVTPKMWGNPLKDRCPIEIYKLYRDLRPVSYSNDDSPFYIACTTISNPHPKAKWFKCQPVGLHKLEGLMKNMAKQSGIPNDRKLTNHSARKHLVQKLNDHNVPPSHIMQISGHKNVNSINNYSHINDQQHKAISSIMSGSASSSMTPYTENLARAPVSTSCVSQQNNKRDHLQSVFGSSTISGGSFAITINNNYSHSAPKHRRPMIESDSE